MEPTVTLRGANVGVAATVRSRVLSSGIAEAAISGFIPLPSAMLAFGSGEFSETQGRERLSIVVDSTAAMVIS